eukprot:5156278-Pleurochrysis_carterae.AAC.3
MRARTCCGHLGFEQLACAKTHKQRHTSKRRWLLSSIAPEASMGLFRQVGNRYVTQLNSKQRGSAHILKQYAAGTKLRRACSARCVSLRSVERATTPLLRRQGRGSKMETLLVVWIHSKCK